MLLDTGWDSWGFLVPVTSAILVSLFQLRLSCESVERFLVCGQQMRAVMIAS